MPVKLSRVLKLDGTDRGQALKGNGKLHPLLLGARPDRCEDCEILIVGISNLEVVLGARTAREARRGKGYHGVVARIDIGRDPAVRSSLHNLKAA